MLSLHTNSASLSTQVSLTHTQKALSSAQTSLGTGYRINSSMDDAAGLQIATRLDAQARGMAVASRNTQNGISLMQTAEGAFSEVNNILLRMKDLATQAADASSSAADQASMQLEFDELGKELGNIMNNTKFGGQTLLKAGKLAAAMTFQIGADASETMAVNLSTQMTAVDTSLTAASDTYTVPGTPGTELTGGTANATITLINTAINDVGTIRAALGANSNRLDHVFNNLQNMSTNTSLAKGRIMDVDYASETANMTTKQMLMQASTSMLKQSNSLSQLTLSLLQ